jgi:DNA processing protein
VTATHTAKTERLTSEQLIALNANLELSRAAVCRLAWSARPWWHGGRVDAETTLRLGVGGSTLAEARRTVARAAAVAAGERRAAERCGARILTRLDGDYPAALCDLALPPPVLYLRGRLPKRPGVSIVGARKASPYGREAAAAFAAGLAARGLAIVSGFARGVDAAAHRAAATCAEGATIAVLGCGLDIDYPRGRRALRRDICANGALLSEFPCGAAPLGFNFPIRNRLIAALGHGTLVIEATARSGSLITARLALELGRDVYAVPGRIFDSKAAGPNTLIRDGAFLVQHPDDVMITLPQAVLDRLPARGAAPRTDASPRLPVGQSEVLAALPPRETLDLEALRRRVDMPVTDLLAALLELELAGWVRRKAGPAYVRCALW